MSSTRKKRKGTYELSDKSKVVAEISKENKASKFKFEKALKRLQCINKIYFREFSFPKWFETCSGSFIKPREDLLKEEYKKLVVKLKSKSREGYKTRAEKRFFSLLEQKSKKHILRSVWVGSHCIDLFIPNVRSNFKSGVPGKVMRGVAIEIDGDCHNYEPKMVKDERKADELMILGIGVTHVKNWDFRKPPVQFLQDHYKVLTSMDSRERARMWRRIYSFTLAVHLSDLEFFRIFKHKTLKRK